ncbi:kinase-like protein [Anaeromyces robustus]|uniref:Kinase-like protein n=1 Tax=Anaeromyces robustus TaxID=1754192 RepID=A0A1Y1WRA7_9FUNG|nr:kinase-like protein [Anaeromyces robustus]|eukprot:ORX76060.1 kinase-like protein [Anaeromyces robustus]
MLILHQNFSSISISKSIDKLCSLEDINVNENGEKRSYVIKHDKEPMETYCSLIFFAYDEIHKRDVVFKQIKDIEWAKKELALMKKLEKNNVPNTIKLLDYYIDEETGDHILIFPYLKKINTYHMNLVTVQKLMKQLISTLKCLNDLNIAHLDITLSNLMCDENDNLILIDFGLSLDCGLKPHPIGCGTPGFIAPELYDGTCNTCTPDVYSSGIVFGILLEPYIPKCGLENLGGRYIRSDIISNMHDSLLENYIYQSNNFRRSVINITGVPVIIYKAADLLYKMTQTDPLDRIKPSEILKHPFMTASEAEFELTTYDNYIERLHSKLIKTNTTRSIEFYS